MSKTEIDLEKGPLGDGSETEAPVAPVTNNDDGANGNDVKPVESQAPAETTDEGEEVPPRKKTYQQDAAEKKLKHAMREVEQVQGMMRDNIDKMLERDAKLNEFEERTEKLEASGKMFENSAGALKSKAMWANIKMTIIMVLIGAAVAYVLYLKYLQ